MMKNRLPIELKAINFNPYYPSTCVSGDRHRVDEVLFISTRLRRELLPASQTTTDLTVSLTHGDRDGQHRSLVLLTQTALVGKVQPELDQALERLNRWIDQQEASSTAPFLVCASHVLFEVIQSTLKFDPHYPLQPHHSLELAPIHAIPLSAVLLQLIDPHPPSISIRSPDFQLELKSKLSLFPRIIRQSEQLHVYLESPSLTTHDNDADQNPQQIIKLSFNVLLTEPVLQGVFLPTQTLLTIVTKAQPSATQTNATTDDETLNLHPVEPIDDFPIVERVKDHTLVQDMDEDLEIDTDFLAHSVLNLPLLDLSSSPDSIFSLGHPCYGLPLLEPPNHTGNRHLDPYLNDDDGYHCFARTADLIKMGVQSGNWLMLTKSNTADEASYQHRLVRIMGCDDDHPTILNFRQRHPQFTTQSSRLTPALLLVPPVLLFNLLGTVSYSAAVRSLDFGRQPPLNALAAGLPPHLSHPCFPTIRSLTLARLASPQALTKSYQPAFLRALKKYFEEKPRVLRDGDVIAIAIDQDLGRFTEPQTAQAEPSTDDLDLEHLLPSSLVSRPTLPIYFKVTNLELSYPTSHQAAPDLEDPVQDSIHGLSSADPVNQLIPLMPAVELIEDGLLGGIVDPRGTKLVQTGLEFGFVPDAKNWLGIDGSTPLFYSPHSTTSSHSPGRILYEYLLAAARVESRNYGLNLTVLISGPRGCGKSTITKRAVEATGFNFLELNCFDLLGETEVKTAGTVRARFERALQAIPCVLLLRHLDGLARKSQSLETGQQPGIIAILKECFNEARRNWTSQSAMKFPLIIVGTTTDPDLLPLSLLALFKTQLSMEAPSEAERLEILQELLRRDLLAPDVSLKSIALETAGLVANDLVHLVSQARMAAVTRARKNGAGIEELVCAGIQLMAKDIEKALGKARSEYSESIGAPRIPKVSWDDIGGLAQVREEILETVQLPIQHPELFANGLKRRSGLLLYGPPGTGKTLLAKAVATSCGLNFFSVKGPELLNMYIGESEANVRRVFERARGARPCVIFFDELDSVAPKRGNQGDSGGVMDRIVSQLLAELDGISSGNTNNDNQQEGAANGSGNGEVVVIGATNRPDLLDPALLRPGRFDKLIYLGIPSSREQKLEILKSLTRKFNLSNSFDFDWLIEEIERIGSQKGGGGDEGGNIFTGADLYSICSEALMASLVRKIERIEAHKSQRSIKTDSPPGGPDGRLNGAEDSDEAALDDVEESAVTQVDQQDFLVALRQVKPSISASELAHYRFIQDQFSDSTRKNPARTVGPVNNGYSLDPLHSHHSLQSSSPAKNKGKAKEIFP